MDAHVMLALVIRHIDRAIFFPDGALERGGGGRKRRNRYRWLDKDYGKRVPFTVDPPVSFAVFRLSCFFFFHFAM